MKNILKKIVISPIIKDYFQHAFLWQKGRQKSGYDKMLLLYSLWPIKFDMYLIRYRVGSFIPPHTDKVTSGKHYRLNIVLKKSKNGGDFICNNAIINASRIKLFRPDINEHSVTKVTEGERYVFSLGWIKD